MKRQPEQTANHELLKQVNVAAVYRIIDSCGPISRVNIAHQSALAPASITNITRLLLEQGLIRETAQEASTGGRRAISLVTIKEHFVFIACRLGREDLQCSVMDLAGTVYHHTVEPVALHDAPELVSSLLQTIRNGQSHQPLNTRCIGIAITMAGLIDSDSGSIIYAPNHQLENVPLATLIEQELQLPVYLGNDTRASALAEYYFGAAQTCQDFLLVTIHHGMGAGIVSNGTLLMGQHRNIGEIGHIQLEPYGEQCHCGNFGCAETLISNPAIVRQAEALLRNGHTSAYLRAPLTIDQICMAAQKNDAVATHILRQTGEYLGRVLSILANLFNPEKILLAGEITAAEHILFPAMKQQIARTVLPSFAVALQLERAAFQKQGTIGGYAIIKRALRDHDLLQRMMAGSAPKPVDSE
jgi:N-acetylglucosamine repressor